MGLVTNLVRIVDGDSIIVNPPYEGENSIRMLGIDCPETNYRGRSQGEYGEQAKDFLHSLIKVGDSIRIIPDTEVWDRYLRVLAYVFKDDVNINVEMVRAGMAVPYPIYPNFKHVPELRQAVIEARTHKRGVFFSETGLRELPFEFRMKVRRSQPNKYVGNYTTKVLYAPHEYSVVDLENRVFFYKRRDALKADYKYRVTTESIADLVDKKYESKTFSEVFTAPVSALQGISENDGKLLDEAFSIKTVEDLADCKYFKWARLIKKSVELEKRQNR